MKKIVFDYTPALQGTKSGVGFYTTLLWQGLNDCIDGQHRLYGFYHNFLGRKNKPEQDGVFIESNVIPAKIIPALKYLNIRPIYEIFNHRKYDFILHTNYVALPSIRKTPYGLVVYDLSFIDHPEYLNVKNLKYLKQFVPKSINKASLIVTISEFTKQRIKEEFPNAKADILVTPIPPGHKPKVVNNIPKRLVDLGVKNNKYILFLGNIEPRKNINNLVESMYFIPKGYSLVLAGGKGWNDDKILDSINKAKGRDIDIIQTGYVTEEEKASLYTNAAIFVLPSHYEGFGMPIMEAMQYDVPIAISNIDVFHEVAGDTAVYFDKDEPRDIAKKVGELINDEVLQKSLISRYKNQLLKFSWDTNAKNMLDAIDKVLEEK